MNARIEPAVALQAPAFVQNKELVAWVAGVAALNVPLLAEIGFGPNWEQAH